MSVAGEDVGSEGAGEGDGGDSQPWAPDGARGSDWNSEWTPGEGGRASDWNSGEGVVEQPVLALNVSDVFPPPGPYVAPDGTRSRVCSSDTGLVDRPLFLATGPFSDDMLVPAVSNYGKCPVYIGFFDLDRQAIDTVVVPPGQYRGPFAPPAGTDAVAAYCRRCKEGKLTITIGPPKIS